MDLPKAYDCDYRVASFPGFHESSQSVEVRQAFFYKLRLSIRPRTRPRRLPLILLRDAWPLNGKSAGRGGRRAFLLITQAPLPLGSSCSHSIPVAHREGRGRLRAWLLENSAIRRHVEVRSVQTAETEEVSLLLRPATGPCVAWCDFLKFTT